MQKSWVFNYFSGSGSYRYPLTEHCLEGSSTVHSSDQRSDSFSLLHPQALKLPAQHFLLLGSSTFRSAMASQTKTKRLNLTGLFTIPGNSKLRLESQRKKFQPLDMTLSHLALFLACSVPKMHLLCASASSDNLRRVELPKLGLRQLVAECKPGISQGSTYWCWKCKKKMFA